MFIVEYGDDINENYFFFKSANLHQLTLLSLLYLAIHVGNTIRL